MSKIIKLPDNLKEWKINAFLSDNKNNEVYRISKSATDEPAILRHLTVYGEDYSDKVVDFLEEEAEFISTIIGLGSKFTYKKVFSENKPEIKKYDLYIVTEDYTPLSEVLKEKTFDEAEVIDFGIQMSGILEVLEANQIFHGNIRPENIYVDENGNYKLGGFTEFEAGISDLTYIAPEIANNTPADYTTDIYSVGLIMYSMCNGGKLPFETSEDTAGAATKRINGGNISAPENGSEKLKSVIVIACQYKNTNRWKNAGNIRNALTSIQNEMQTEATGDNTDDTSSAAPVVAAVAATSFDGNMFDDYGFEDESTADDNAEDTTSDTTDNTSSEELSTEASADDNSAESFDTDIHSNSAPVIISSGTTFAGSAGDAFENFDVDGAEAVPANQTQPSDYGDFFEDDKSSDEEPEAQTEEFGSFEENNTASPVKQENNKKENKGAIVAIVLSVIAILAALGFIAFCIFSTNSNNNDNKQETTVPTTVPATKPTTTPATTAPATTTAPVTTKSADIIVTNVVGYNYTYAEIILKEQGFNIAYNDFVYSDIYEDGQVVSMSPEGEAIAKEGDTIYLTVSRGPETPKTEPPTEPKTEAPTQSPESSQSFNTNNSGGFVFPNSSSSYITQSQVNSLSKQELDYAINEIYARNGRIFTSPELASYFGSKSWYKPLYTPEEFDKKVTLNIYEQTNLNLLVNAR